MITKFIIALQKGDNPDFKNTGQLFFEEESIYESSRPYLKLVTDGHTDSC